MATSSGFCKPQILQWIRARVPTTARVLDVGAGVGTYAKLLREYTRMEAVEVWQHYIEKFGLARLYCAVHATDALSFLTTCDQYDLVILGDVLEHLTAENGQLLVELCKLKTNTIVVSVPYLYGQGAIYNNPWEIHRQADLTHDVFLERYPGFLLICEEGGMAAWAWTR